MDPVVAAEDPEGPGRQPPVMETMVQEFVANEARHERDRQPGRRFLSQAVPEHTPEPGDHAGRHEKRGRDQGRRIVVMPSMPRGGQRSFVMIEPPMNDILQETVESEASQHNPGVPHPGPVLHPEGMKEETAGYQGIDQDAEPIVEGVSDQVRQGLRKAIHSTILPRPS